MEFCYYQSQTSESTYNSNYQYATLNSALAEGAYTIFKLLASRC